jgi:hypothetical protein
LIGKATGLLEEEPAMSLDDELELPAEDELELPLLPLDTELEPLLEEDEPELLLVEELVLPVDAAPSVLSPPPHAVSTAARKNPLTMLICVNRTVNIMRKSELLIFCNSQ